MANVPFPNEYTLRTVAESASKPCYVCHKASTKVLTTVENKDFFYTCLSHLTDRGFASPIIDPKVEAEKKRQEALAREKEAIIKEYEEKTEENKWFWQKDEKKDKDSKAKKAEDEKDEKLKALGATLSNPATAALLDEGPRQFTLNKQFYQMRLDRRQNIEKSKRDQQRVKDPSFFPRAPTGDIA
ncbi:hypothetical protein H2198_008807 [Neophaeococcomyces mojaviensis]|uniref:Uncharacterized protein n=1 Tax=Neophaeococcomyces mojaviensis TaxID=3383035 RepID=A0ACC2ZW97_9EURO|nr:hypothetical protein H2198_008807 [Knufia sp. JES_112]